MGNIYAGAQGETERWNLAVGEAAGRAVVTHGRV